MKFFICTSLLALSAYASNTDAAPGSHGPNGEHLDAPASGSSSGLARLPDGSVNISKQVQRRLAIRTVMVVTGEHAHTVELNGRVGIDPNAGGRVQASFAGRIEAAKSGLPAIGQKVKKGEILAYLHPVATAIDRGNQQAQLAEIRASTTLAEQRIQRLEALEGSVPLKELQAARAELISLKGREKAISGSIAGMEAITASASGNIASASVLSGQIVEARDVLFDIVDANRMVIEATTADIKLASQVTGASLNGFPDVKLSLIGFGRALRDGALPLSFRASTASSALAAGLPVTVTVQLKDKVDGISLPAEAVVRNANNEPVVWIKAGSERFIAMPIQYQTLDATTIVATKGLAPENRVVVSGAALINQIR
ncbi:hypothetical protein DBR37_12915 [Herminiimonas sp. KBW02]|nr:hypothetical protein DBR37_12915 [Herminiimonas sp. KBW02]